MTFINKPLDNLSPQNKYSKLIQEWDRQNSCRRFPKRYFVLKLQGEDANRNGIFASFELGNKFDMIFRAYIGKIAGLLPPSKLQQKLFRISGILIEENVFIAPELTIDVVLKYWTKIRKNVAIGVRVSCFNHMFDHNGRIILGYIDIEEGASIGAFTVIGPGVRIGKNADIGAEVKIGPGVEIGNNAKIGPGCILAPFVRIGEGAIIGTCSVVTKNVNSNTKVSGNPAVEILTSINHAGF